MYLKKLSLINFRSYPELSISFPPQGVLLEGLNGVGKTNILESIYLLCTGRSQRGASRGDMIAIGQDAAFVEGEFSSDSPQSSPQLLSPPSTRNETATSTSTTAAIGFSRDKKVVMKRDNLDVRSYSEWFGERPVVSFGTDDLDLVYGAPDFRRKFLDMLICQLDRGYLEALSLYKKSMACRNALLGRTSDDVQFAVYEHAMAEAAAEIVAKRAEIVLELCEATQDFYSEISNSGEFADIEYAPKIKQKIKDFSTESQWHNVYLNTLRENRGRDAELMYTSVGPHRDDLRFLMNGRLAKSYASQGQCRSFALSLKLGSVRLLERRREGGMIFLVDDAVSELDPERTSRVYPLLEGRGQIFIAAPRCPVELGGGILRCAVEPGRVTVS